MQEKQSRFARMAALLILYAAQIGFEVTFGDAYRDPRAEFPYGQPRSLHKSRLAIDLNVFRDGEYLQKTEDYSALGDFWESIGGSWGGRFGDGNHFSLAHDGRK